MISFLLCRQWKDKNQTSTIYNLKQGLRLLETLKLMWGTICGRSPQLTRRTPKCVRWLQRQVTICDKLTDVLLVVFTNSQPVVFQPPRPPAQEDTIATLRSRFLRQSCTPVSVRIPLINMELTLDLIRPSSGLHWCCTMSCIVAWTYSVVALATSRSMDAGCFGRHFCTKN